MKEIKKEDGLCHMKDEGTVVKAKFKKQNP